MVTRVKMQYYHSNIQKYGITMMHVQNHGITMVTCLKAWYYYGYIKQHGIIKAHVQKHGNNRFYMHAS